MHVLKLDLSDEEFDLLKEFSKANSISMSTAIKKAIFEKIEDEYDIKEFDKAYSKYAKDPKTYSLKQVEKILD